MNRPRPRAPGVRQTNKSNDRDPADVHAMLMESWHAHFNLPIEQQVLIDSERLLPVFETMRLYRKAMRGELL